MEAKIFLKGANRPIFRRANQVKIVEFSNIASSEDTLEQTIRRIGGQTGREPLFVVSCNEIDSIEVADTFRREEDGSFDENQHRRPQR